VLCRAAAGALDTWLSRSRRVGRWGFSSSVRCARELSSRHQQLRRTRAPLCALQLLAIRDLLSCTNLKTALEAPGEAQGTPRSGGPMTRMDSLGLKVELEPAEELPDGDVGD